MKKVFYNKGKTLYKVFIIIFTSASSRAIRLDIISDASWSSFIRSLKRFISINGVSDLYVSDNAKCFTGQELKDYLSTLSASWRYISEVPHGREGFENEWFKFLREVMVQVVMRSRKMLPKNFVKIKTYI